MSDLQHPIVRVVPGRLIVNGVPTECLCDVDGREVVVSDCGDRLRLAATAFNAGREYERAAAEEWELRIDDRLGFPPDV